MVRSHAPIIAAIDQGTTSTRCMLFHRSGEVAAISQMEHAQLMPKAGWVEHDPLEIWANTKRVMADALAQTDFGAGDIAALGITNQRETTVVWDATTGEPIHPAIVWQDTRTAERITDFDSAMFAHTGLPVSPYFSGPKMSWILDSVPGARLRAQRGELLAGTIDSWLVWKLTRGKHHVTDVTNASRTMLMDLASLSWDSTLTAAVGVPDAMLPTIVPSVGIIGEVTVEGPFRGVPIAGILGDQQAATFGQACLRPGEAKNTYGTGNFLLLNTGESIQHSRHGLITTVCYQVAGKPAVYALEGSIAVTGSLVQWLRDNLGIIDSAAEIEALARSVPDSGGMVIVPAFSGLLAPYWRPDARGIIAGLTRFHGKAHIARAALEAVAFQTREVVAAMNQDAGVELQALKVDGGMVGNSLLMQFQADQLQCPVIVPQVTETTALGAAYAAGLGVGVYADLAEIRGLWRAATTYYPQDAPDRDSAFARWSKGVARSFDWVEQGRSAEP
ncbi:glycerol kinase GlpK [Corynebacterium choanae]|nr:glycerol kinase GlpK [Corynebacterium choanae]